MKRLMQKLFQKMIPLDLQKDLLKNQTLRGFINMKQNFPEYQEEISDMINYRIRYQTKLMNKEKDMILELFNMLPKKSKNGLEFLEPVIDRIEKEIVNHYAEFRRQKKIWLKLSTLHSGCHLYKCN